MTLRQLSIMLLLARMGAPLRSLRGRELLLEFTAVFTASFMHCACLLVCLLCLKLVRSPLKLNITLIQSLNPLAVNYIFVQNVLFILYFSALLSLIPTHCTQWCTFFKEMLVPLSLLL